MLCRFVAPLVLLLPACGARSTLDAGEPRGMSADASASDAHATSDATPDAVVLPPNGCTSALARGAGAAMRGYCSTRANLSPVLAPRNPRVVWSQALAPNERTPTTTVDGPIDIVVDAAGRAYVMLGLSSYPDYEEAPDYAFVVAAVDADGTTAWSQTFGSTEGYYFLGNLQLLADGNLWFVGGPVGPAALFVLAPDGALVRQTMIPPLALDALDGFWDLANVVGREGSLYFFVPLSRYGLTMAVQRVSPDGTAAWTSPPVPGGGARFALDANDNAVVAGISDPATLTALASVSPAGQLRWQRGITAVTDGHYPTYAIGPAGEAVMCVLSSTGDAALVSVDANGDVAWNAAIGDRPSDLAPSLAIAMDGTIIAGAQSTVVAVDRTGTIRWRYPIHSNQLQVDPEGTVIVTGDSAIVALDLATGTKRWELPPAQCGYVVLGPNRTLYGSQCNGVLFMARDP